MKKFFTILGYFAGALVVIVAVIAAIFIPRALRLQKEGTYYIKANIPAIVGHWDADALRVRATPELIKSSKSPEDLARLFRYFSALGEMRNMQEPVAGSVYSGSTIENGAYTVAEYTIQGTFDKGPATVSVQLLKTTSGWQINGFHVNSDAFLPK